LEEYRIQALETSRTVNGHGGSTEDIALTPSAHCPVGQAAKGGTGRGRSRDAPRNFILGKAGFIRERGTKTKRQVSTITRWDLPSFRSNTYRTNWCTGTRKKGPWRNVKWCRKVLRFGGVRRENGERMSSGLIQCQRVDSFTRQEGGGGDVSRKNGKNQSQMSDS